MSNKKPTTPEDLGIESYDFQQRLDYCKDTIEAFEEDSTFEKAKIQLHDINSAAQDLADASEDAIEKIKQAMNDDWDNEIRSAKATLNKVIEAHHRLISSPSKEKLKSIVLSLLETVVALEVDDE